MNSKGMLSKITTNRKGAEYHVKPTGPCIPKRIRATRRASKVAMVTGEDLLRFINSLNAEG